RWRRDGDGIPHRGRLRRPSPPRPGVARSLPALRLRFRRRRSHQRLPARDPALRRTHHRLPHARASRSLRPLVPRADVLQGLALQLLTPTQQPGPALPQQPPLTLSSERPTRRHERPGPQHPTRTSTPCTSLALTRSKELNMRKPITKAFAAAAAGALILAGCSAVDEDPPTDDGTASETTDGTD